MAPPGRREPDRLIDEMLEFLREALDIAMQQELRRLAGSLCELHPKPSGT